MCRWLAYSGPPVRIGDVLFRAEHSLIDQSLRARSSAETTNGDGFGLAWYGEYEVPGLYRHTQPAWNDMNLRDIGDQIRSAMFLAHVRAATSASVQQTNCHPFRHGAWLFQHNGLIARFDRVRRRMAMEIDATLFNSILGTTDSEYLFYLALTYGLADDPHGALTKAVGLVERLANEEGIEHPVQMTLGLADGKRLYAVRYSSTGISRTLFRNTGRAALEALCPALPSHDLDRAVTIVSEPFSDLQNGWEEIRESSFVIVEDGRVEQRGFEPAAP